MQLAGADAGGAGCGAALLPGGHQALGEGLGCGRVQAGRAGVWDNGPVHTSRATRAALAERPWITGEWLPCYTPELNDIERSWRDLK